MSSITPKQIIAAQKADVEMTFAVLNEILGSLGKLVELNVQAAKSMLAEHQEVLSMAPSAKHQLEDKARCPAHQQSLETRCPRCRRETPYLINTRVIGAPFRCVWCHSHFSYGRLSLLSTTPAMRRQDRIAISRRGHLRLGNVIDPVSK